MLTNSTRCVQYGLSALFRCRVSLLLRGVATGGQTETGLSSSASSIAMRAAVLAQVRARASNKVPTTLITNIDFESHPFKAALTQLGYAVKTKDILRQVDGLIACEPSDVMTYETIFRALGKADLWEKAAAVFDNISSPTLECYRGVLRVLAGDVLEVADVPSSSHRSKEALKLFNRMLYTGLIPDCDCVASFITTQRKSGNVDEVERAFQWLQDNKIPISQGCFNAFMLSCGSRLHRAQQVFAMCDAAGKLNAVPFYGLILSARSDWRLAINTLKRMIEAPYFLTPVLSQSFDAALRACEQAKHVEATQAAFEIVSSWGQRPEAAVPQPHPLSSTGITHLLKMCGEGPAFVLSGVSNPHKARYWLEEAKRLKFAPMPGWYESAIEACSKGAEGELVEEMAIAFFNEARGHGLKLSLLMYHRLIAVLSDWSTIGQLLRIVVESPELRPDTPFVSYILERLLADNQVRKAQKFYSLSVEREFVPSHWISYNPPVVNLYSGTFALSLCALKAAMKEMHDLYVMVQSSAKKQSARPRRLKHSLHLVCSLETIADVQKKLGAEMSITSHVLTEAPKDAGYRLPASCAILEVDTRELTFWHTRGALGI